MVFVPKHYTRLERLDRDKHSNLFRKTVNYGSIILAPGGKTFVFFCFNEREKKFSRSDPSSKPAYLLASSKEIFDAPDGVETHLDPIQKSFRLLNICTDLVKFHIRFHYF